MADVRAASERPRVYRQNLHRYWTPGESHDRKLAFQPLLNVHCDFAGKLKPGGRESRSPRFYSSKRLLFKLQTA